jgi:hypothetical protein
MFLYFAVGCQCVSNLHPQWLHVAFLILTGGGVPVSRVVLYKDEKKAATLLQQLNAKRCAFLLMHSLPDAGSWCVVAGVGSAAAVPGCCAVAKSFGCM